MCAARGGLARGGEVTGRPAGASAGEGDNTDRDRLLVWAVRAQRLHSLGLLAGNIAHDLNNLLMAILGRAELSSAQLGADSPVQEHLRHMTSAARRAADIVNQLLVYSGRGRRAGSGAPWTVTLRELAPLVEVTASKRCRVVWELADRMPPVEADAVELRHVLLNLVLNASEAMGDRGGTITIRSGTAWCDRPSLEQLRPGAGLAAGEYAFLEVADTGPGMPDSVLAHAGEPFYSTRGEGRGLGLAVVRDLAARRGGAVQVESRDGIGTRVRVLLHAAAPCPAPAPSAPTEAAAPAPCGVVLVADDEVAVRELMTLMLQRAGFTAVTVADGKEAVEHVRVEPDRYDVVLLDHTMPEMNGDEAFRKIRALQPAMPVVLASGFGEEVATDALFAEGLAGFIHKPASGTELAAAIRKALARSVSE